MKSEIAKLKQIIKSVTQTMPGGEVCAGVPGEYLVTVEDQKLAAKIRAVHEKQNGGT